MRYIKLLAQTRNLWGISPNIMDQAIHIFSSYQSYDDQIGALQELCAESAAKISSYLSGIFQPLPSTDLAGADIDPTT
jgi:hypothetical protein